MTLPEIKPCPMCDSAGELREYKDGHAVFCTETGPKCFPGPGPEPKEKAIKGWNDFYDSYDELDQRIMKEGGVPLMAKNKKKV